MLTDAGAACMVPNLKLVTGILHHENASISL